MNTKSLNIFIYTFAIIGLVSILSSFNSQPEDQQTHSAIPESHVWEMVGFDNDFFMWNKKTGELRKVNGNSFDAGSEKMFTYGTMYERE